MFKTASIGDDDDDDDDDENDNGGECCPLSWFSVIIATSLLFPPVHDDGLVPATVNTYCISLERSVPDSSQC